MALSINDPYYTTGVAGWLRSRVDSLGIDVAVRDDLAVPGFGDRAAGVVYVRPGLDLVRFHWLLSRGVVHSLFGPEAAPDFRTVEDVGMGRVVPLRRGRAY